MRHEFFNGTPVAIGSGPPTTIVSPIEVTGLPGATVLDIEVRVDISHSWIGDLTLTLIAPDDTRVVLVRRRGGSRDDFTGTLFRADAQMAISAGVAPYGGTFRAEEDLAQLHGTLAAGLWRLEVADNANQDGGALNRWSLGLTTSAVTPSPFAIDVRFLGGLTPNQQAAFADAAARWSQIITADLPPGTVEGELIDDVLIEARGETIDGPSGTLGAAGPTWLRPGSLLPIKGIMRFDTADLAMLEANGTLGSVIEHEMAHVLGFGTLWAQKGLIQGAGTVDPVFVGTNAMREYGHLRHQADPSLADVPTPVPVANTGGAGTRDGHWREAVFGDELLTGFLSGPTRPLSAMSIGAFEDMGYQITYAAADAFGLPSMLRIAELGLMGLRHACDTCAVTRPDVSILPPSAVHNDP